MKNITQILSEEHQTILKVIDAALKECTEIENGKALRCLAIIYIIFQENHLS